MTELFYVDTESAAKILNCKPANLCQYTRRLSYAVIFPRARSKWGGHPGPALWYEPLIREAAKIRAEAAAVGKRIGVAVAVKMALLRVDVSDIVQ